MDSMSESDTTQPLSEGKVNKQNHSCANRSGLHRYYFGLGAKQNRDPDSRDPTYFQGKRKSARRDSNPRPPPWQGGAPPLSHSRLMILPPSISDEIHSITSLYENQVLSAKFLRDFQIFRENAFECIRKF